MKQRRIIMVMLGRECRTSRLETRNPTVIRFIRLVEVMRRQRKC